MFLWFQTQPFVHRSGSAIGVLFFPSPRLFPHQLSFAEDLGRSPLCHPPKGVAAWHTRGFPPSHSRWVFLPFYSASPPPSPPGLGNSTSILRQCILAFCIPEMCGGAGPNTRSAQRYPNITGASVNFCSPV